MKRFKKMGKKLGLECLKLDFLNVFKIRRMVLLTVALPLIAFSFIPKIALSFVQDDVAGYWEENFIAPAPNGIDFGGSNNIRESRGSSGGNVKMSCNVHNKGLAVDNATGNIHIVDYLGHTVSIFTNAGDPILNFGWHGVDIGEPFFGYPNGVDVDSSGNIYAVYPGNRSLPAVHQGVYIFDDTGNVIRKFDSKGSGDGQFMFPEDIAVDNTGNIYVADTDNNRIQIFDNSINFIRKFGSSGSGNGKFDHPRGIAVDGANNIYVADTGNNRIQVFDSFGNFIRKFGSNGSGNGEFNYPRGIDVDNLGNIYVADRDNKRVQIFDNSGNFIRKISGSTDRLNDVEVDNAGNIYFLDGFNNGSKIQVFDNSGSFIRQFNVPYYPYENEPSYAVTLEITPLDLSYGWGTFEVDSSIPADTDITYEILDSFGAKIMDVVPGQDISSIAQTSIKIKAIFSNTNHTKTPVISNLKVTWERPPTVTTEAWIPDDSMAVNYIPDGGVVNLDDIDDVGEYFTIYSTASDASGLYNHKVKMQVGAMTITLIDCWDANSDGLCDFMGDIRIADLKSDSTGDIAAQLQVGPFSDGDVVSYWSEATDTALPVGNSGSSVAQSFTVKGMMTWAKAYGGSGDEYAAFSVQQTSGDDGYIIAGHTYSYGAGNADFLITKLDSSGVQEWSRTFGGGDVEITHSIQQTSDGEYIIAGRTGTYGAGGVADILIIKLDSNGDKKWARTFGGPGDDMMGWDLVGDSFIQQTADGGYVFTGYTNSVGIGGAWRVLAVKINPDTPAGDFGGIEWARTFGTTNISNFINISSSIQQTFNGEYIISGWSKNSNTGNDDILIIKLDSDGDKKWAKTLTGDDGEYVERACSIQQTDDNGDGQKDDGYIVTGWGGVIKINADTPTGDFGGIDWAKAFSGDFRAVSQTTVRQTLDGEYVIAGSYGAAGDDSDFLVVKVGYSPIFGFQQKWVRTFGGDGDDIARSIQQASDGGYIISGGTESFGAGGYDFLLVKLDQNGDMENCSPPLDNPLGNLFFSIDIIVTDDASLSPVISDVAATLSTFDVTAIIGVDSPTLNEVNVCPSSNTSPTVTPSDPSVPTDWCDSSPGSISLPWAFDDAEDGAGNQTAYQIDLSRSDGNTCTSGKQGSPAVPDDTNSLSGAEINLFATDPGGDPGCANFISYGGYTYSWQIKVYDSAGDDSGFVPGAPFPPSPTPLHQYPTAKFSYSAPSDPPKQFENITFDPLTPPSDSQAYGGASIVSFEWDFDGDGTIDSTTFPPPADPTIVHSYAADGSFVVDMKVTDTTLPVGYSCWASDFMTVPERTIPIGEGKAKWNETTP